MWRKPIKLSYLAYLPTYLPRMHMHLHCMCVLPICVLISLEVTVIAITQTQQALLQKVNVFHRALAKTQQGQSLVMKKNTTACDGARVGLAQQETNMPCN